jgi:competence protein ComGC
MSDKGATLEQRNEVAPVKKGKRKSCMRHCKRFWWAYLIAFVLIVVLVVCLIIFVAVPKIAQSKINEAELDIQAVRILDTESDAYRMEIDSTIRTDGHIKAKVYPFEGVMYLEDKEGHVPFATLDFPETSSAKEQVVNITQDVKISDMDAFRDFNIWFHNNETLRITVEGKTQVKPKGLSRKYDVDFKKTLEIKGLNVFSGTEVTEGEISIEADDDGKNFHGVADIPNASHFTLDIGNVSFSNFVGDVFLGHLFIDNLILRPGSNVVNISANINQIRTLGILRNADAKVCESGVLDFKLLGDNVTNHGQDLSYFAAALASVNQTVPIDIGSMIEKALDQKVNCVNS